MSTKPIRGLKQPEALMMARAIQQEGVSGSEPVNARCEKCGGLLRAPAALLAGVKMGVADHAGCGGTFRLYTP